MHQGQPDFSRTICNLRDDRGNHRSGRLTQPVSIEWGDDADRRAERPIEGHFDLIGTYLAGRIR